LMVHPTSSLAKQTFNLVLYISLLPKQEWQRQLCMIIRYVLVNKKRKSA
jgi:hypothetical protein